MRTERQAGIKMDRKKDTNKTDLKPDEHKY